MPWFPLPYEGTFEGWTLISDASGRVLAGRAPEQGEGVAIAEVEPGRSQPIRRPPDRFWLHRRGAIPAFTWWYQRLWGRPWYSEHVAGRPAPRQRQPAAVA
jgi:hypothetical protein